VSPRSRTLTALVAAHLVRPLAALTMVATAGIFLVAALHVRGLGLLAAIALGPVFLVAYRAADPRRPGTPAAPDGIPATRADLLAIVAEEAAALRLPAPGVLLSAGRDVSEHDDTLVVGALALAERPPAQLRVAVMLALLSGADPARRRLRALREGPVARAVAIAAAQPSTSLPWAWLARLADRLALEALQARTLAMFAVAARRHGEALVTAELRSSAQEPRFDRYWGSFVVPCLRAGFRPPLAEGWRRALLSPVAAPEPSADVVEALTLVAREGTGVTPPASPAAWEDAELPEAEILAARDTGELVPVSWAHAGRAVMVPSLRAQLGRDAWFAGATVGELAELGPRDDPAGEDAEALFGALVLAFADAGWDVVIEPGEGARLEGEPFGVEASGLALDAVAGELDPQHWRAFAAEAGIADLPLLPAPEAPGPVADPDGPPRAGAAPAVRELEALAALAPPVTVRIPVAASRAVRIRAAIAGAAVTVLCVPLAAMSASAAFTPGLPAGAGTFLLALAATLIAVPLALAWLRVRPIVLRGELVIDAGRVRLEHRGLLRAPFEVPRMLLRAAVLDGGGDRDDEGHPARFPVAGYVWEAVESERAGIHGWLWTAGMRGFIPELTVANDAPGLALVFSEPVPGPVPRASTLAGPQRGEAIGGLLLPVEATEALRRALADAGFRPRIEREDALRLYTAFFGEDEDPAAPSPAPVG
jgi:hypothetical protein